MNLSPTCNFIKDFPKDIVFLIFNQLPRHSIYNCERACKEWRQFMMKHDYPRIRLIHLANQTPPLYKNMEYEIRINQKKIISNVSKLVSECCNKRVEYYWNLQKCDKCLFMCCKEKCIVGNLCKKCTLYLECNSCLEKVPEQFLKRECDICDLLTCKKCMNDKNICLFCENCMCKKCFEKSKKVGVGGDFRACKDCEHMTWCRSCDNRVSKKDATTCIKCNYSMDGCCYKPKKISDEFLCNRCYKNVYKSLLDDISKDDLMKIINK
jgi:F-box domain